MCPTAWYGSTVRDSITCYPWGICPSLLHWRTEFCSDVARFAIWISSLKSVVFRGRTFLSFLFFSLFFCGYLTVIHESPRGIFDVGVQTLESRSLKKKSPEEESRCEDILHWWASSFFLFWTEGYNPVCHLTISVGFSQKPSEQRLPGQPQCCVTPLYSL
jgi:hypothetical protein